MPVAAAKSARSIDDLANVVAALLAHAVDRSHDLLGALERALRGEHADHLGDRVNVGRLDEPSANARARRQGRADQLTPLIIAQRPEAIALKCAVARGADRTVGRLQPKHSFADDRKIKGPAGAPVRAVTRRAYLRDLNAVLGQPSAGNRGMKAIAGDIGQILGRNIESALRRDHGARRPRDSVHARMVGGVYGRIVNAVWQTYGCARASG